MKTKNSQLIENNRFENILQLYYNFITTLFFFVGIIRTESKAIIWRSLEGEPAISDLLTLNLAGFHNIGRYNDMLSINKLRLTRREV